MGEWAAVGLGGGDSVRVGKGRKNLTGEPNGKATKARPHARNTHTKVYQNPRRGTGGRVPEAIYLVKIG